MEPKRVNRIEEILRKHSKVIEENAENVYKAILARELNRELPTDSRHQDLIKKVLESYGARIVELEGDEDRVYNVIGEYDPESGEIRLSPLLGNPLTPLGKLVIHHEELHKRYPQEREHEIVVRQLEEIERLPSPHNATYLFYYHLEQGGYHPVLDKDIIDTLLRFAKREPERNFLTDFFLEAAKHERDAISFLTRFVYPLYLRGIGKREREGVYLNDAVADYLEVLSKHRDLLEWLEKELPRFKDINKAIESYTENVSEEHIPLLAFQLFLTRFREEAWRWDVKEEERREVLWKLFKTLFKMKKEG